MPLIRRSNGQVTVKNHPIYFHIAAIGVAVFATYVLLIYLPLHAVAIIWAISLSPRQTQIVRIVAPVLPTIVTIFITTCIAIKSRRKKETPFSKSSHRYWQRKSISTFESDSNYEKKSR